MLAPWAIYSEEPSRWPRSPGRTFVPAAVAALADLLFGYPVAEIEGEMRIAKAGGEVLGIVAFFEELITDGELTTFVRPFGLTGAQRLAHDAWDADSVRNMVATGTCSRPVNGGGAATHWVFLREAEVETVLDLYRGGGDVHDEHDRRLGVILGSLRGVPDRSAGRYQEDAAPLLSRFPSARIELNSSDIARLVQMGREWLERQFDDPANEDLLREDFERMAIEEFRPVMTGKRFGYVWDDVTALDRYEHRKKTGPRRRPRSQT